MLQASVLLLIVSIWFPGATRVAGTDGSISFFLALYCAVAGIPYYGELTRRLHRTEATFATAALTISAAIIILSLLSMLHAEIPMRTMRAVFAQVFGFAMVPAVLVISMMPNGHKAVERLVSAAVVMSFVTSCLVIAGMGDARFADRAEGYFKHANQLGIALSAGLPLVAALLITERKYRVLLWGCLAAVVLGLVKSGSKTNFVVGISGLGILYGLYGVYLTIRRQRPLAIILGVVTAPLLLGASLVTLQVLNPRAYRLLTVQLTGGEAHSVVSRERLWSISIDLGLLHPFAGVGAGQWVRDIAPHSHNLLIEYFRTLGVPGLALITVMVLLVGTYLISAILFTLNAKGASEDTAKTDVMVLGSAVSVLNYIVANQMSDSFGPSTAPFFWLPLALLIFYRGLQRSVRSGLVANAQLGIPAPPALIRTLRI